MAKRGIFCLEGDWWRSLKRAPSVRPILELLNQPEVSNIPFIYRDIGTKEELLYYLRKWTLKAHQDYPILYLGFHGAPGLLYVGERRYGGGTCTLDELEECLQGRCHDRILHFGTCSTINLNGNRLNRFLRETNALAMSGYRIDVDWVLSAAFELIMFSSMVEYSLTVNGVRAIVRRLKRETPHLYKALDFRMVIRKPLR